MEKTAKDPVSRLPNKRLVLLALASVLIGVLIYVGYAATMMWRQQLQYEAVVSKQVDLYEETADVLASVKTPAIANEDKGLLAKIDALQSRSEALAKQAAGLPRPSEDVIQSHAARMERAIAAIRREFVRIKKLPGGVELVKRIGSIGK